jgi:hypothetical protein
MARSGKRKAGEAPAAMAAALVPATLTKSRREMRFFFDFFILRHTFPGEMRAIRTKTGKKRGVLKMTPKSKLK